MDIKEWFPEFQVSAETDTELQSYFFQLPDTTWKVRKIKLS